MTLPAQYGVLVGGAWVAIDFEAQALYVTVRNRKSAKTVELGNGVLVDYAEDGELIGVEVVG